MKEISVKYFNYYDAIVREDQKDVHVLAVTDFYGLKAEDFYKQYTEYKGQK